MSAEQNSTENSTESAPASIFPLVAGVDLDSYDEYESGAIDQHARCEYGARILAFAAIRRAVAIARHHDALAQKEKDDHPDQWHYCEWDYWQHDEARNAVRRAIRAAIRSDKA